MCGFYVIMISTETALLKVQTDILTALDRGSVAVLLMLDLSAAFDTIDHPILLTRLKNTFGITGHALQWFDSYLSNRYQCFTMGEAVSEDEILKFGVPQGSVLGPKVYCMYSKPVGDIIQKHGLTYHCYADDTVHHVKTIKRILAKLNCVSNISKIG
jgi:hypothetical protein